MKDNHCIALIIEDDDEDFFLLQRKFDKIQDLKLSYHRCSNLKEAREKLQDGDYNLLIMDLTLPDGDASTTLAIMQSYTAKMPVIVLTGLSDPKMGQQSLQLGVQDFLVKGKIETDMLARSIRYAIERFSLSQTLNEMRVAREVANIENLSAYTLGEDADSEKATSLSKSKPDVFSDLVKHYSKMLDDLVAQKMHGVSYDVLRVMDSISNRLFDVEASSEDVVDLHYSALREKLSRMDQAQYYLDISNSVGLKLMGELLDRYRKITLESNLNIS